MSTEDKPISWFEIWAAINRAKPTNAAEEVEITNALDAYVAEMVAQAKKPLATALSHVLGVLDESDYSAALEDGGPAELARGYVSAARRLLGHDLDMYEKESSEWAYQSFMKGEPEKPPERATTLESKLRNHLHQWLQAWAPRVRRDAEQASIKIRIFGPGSDDDGILVLEYDIEEEGSINTHDDNAGRVPGVYGP
jgi:hypothetical protein